MAERKKRGSGFKNLGPYYIISGIIIILLIIIIILINNQINKNTGLSEYETDTITIPDTEKETDKNDVTAEGIRDTEKIENAADKPVKTRKPEMIFVIDDVGNSKAQLEKFLKVPYPVTFAVMPDRKYTKECVELIKQAGKDYILHQPMEAVGNSDPGKSAIYTGISKEEIHAILEHNFRQVPGAKGMNNHMGSAATSDEEVMDAVMEYLSANNLFFLDSYTISNSLGKKAAEKYNVNYMKRNSMFLDNENDHKSIQNAINEGKKAAGKNGHAVMIGHVMTDELAGLMLDLYPNFIEDGFSLREISELFVEMNSPVTEED